MITKFKLYLTKLNISESRIFEEKEKEEDWKLKLNISRIWNDALYENVNELISFNDQYINFLNQQKNLIIKQTSENAWIKLEELIKRLEENKDKIVESNSVWDDIYDWADGNMIQIKAQENENTELKKDF